MTMCGIELQAIEKELVVDPSPSSPALFRSLTKEDRSLLFSLIMGLLDSCIVISSFLRNDNSTSSAGTVNTFGEEQLKADVQADKMLTDFSRSHGAVRAVASEEHTNLRELSSTGRFVLCWDPLDGSSVIGTNFTVGTIIGIWKISSDMKWNGLETLIKQKPRGHQIASVVALYGPRTVALVALPSSHKPCITYHLTLNDAKWRVDSQGSDPAACCFDHGRGVKVYAPANMRATETVPWYKKLVVDFYMKNQYTLRYTGALVPDTYQLVCKKGGIFVNPISEKTPAKLRLLYETAPIAMCIEGAGGKAVNPAGDWSNILDMEIISMDHRTGLCCGSVEEVDHVIRSKDE